MAIKLDFKESTLKKAIGKEIKAAKLSSALKTVEKAQADEKRKGDAPAMEAAKAAMESAAAAASETIKKECDAKKHKDLVNALKKLASDCQAEVKRLSDAIKGAAEEAEGDEDEADVNELLNADQFEKLFKKVKAASNAGEGPGFCFCFHAKDGKQSKLGLALNATKAKQAMTKLRRVLPKQDPDFKKKFIIRGSAYRSDKFLVLEPDAGEGMPNVPGIAKKLKDWVKENRKNIVPMKKVAIRIPGAPPIEVDVDDEEQTTEAGTAPEQEAEAEAGAAAGGPEAVTSGGAAPAAGEAATQAASEAATPGAEQAGAEQATDDAAIDDRRKQFRKARRAWQTVKEKAIQDLEAVKDGIRDYYLDDPEQFKVATGKLGQLDAIMDNLGDELRDVLDQYVSTPKSRKSQMDQLATQAKSTVDQFLKFASSDKLLNAVDQKEFADVQVKAPIEKALRDLVKTLA